MTVHFNYFFGPESLYALIAGNFLQGIHRTSWILLCKSCQLYQSFFAKSSATPILAFPHLNALSDQKRILRAKFSFFRTSQLSSKLAFCLHQKVHAYCLLLPWYVNQNHSAFFLASTLLSVFVFSLCSKKQINWFKSQLNPLTKIYQI